MRWMGSLRVGWWQARRRAATVVAAVVLSLGLTGARASADELAPAPPLALVVRTAGLTLDPELVRQAVSEELACWVVAVDPTTVLPAYASLLSVDISAGAPGIAGVLTVGYRQPDRRPLVRVLPAPADVMTAIRTIAWLAGNMVRDQAADLLGPAPSPAPAPAEPAPPTPVPTVVAARQPPAAGDGRAFIVASLFFPLATNPNASVTANISLNLVYGRIGALEHGVQLGTANVVGGDAGGAQLGLLFNETGGNLDGVQIAPVNRTGGSVRGLQLALVNRTGGDVDGAQAGLVNAAGDVRGLQLGLVNVGRRVKGVQLGLVNISDDIEGLPIGIINVSATGGVHPSVWSSGTTRLAAGLKFSTRHLYTLFSGAAHEDRGLRLYGPGLALGFRFPIRRVVFETDLGGTYLFGGPLTGVSRQEGLKDDIALASWRALIGVELHRRFTLFAGAALTTRLRFFQVQGHDVSYEVGPDLFAGVQL
jgi:hypothetical protein